jgi:hypothetical protein
MKPETSGAGAIMASSICSQHGQIRSAFLSPGPPIDGNPPKLYCTRSSCNSVIQRRFHIFARESHSKQAAGIRAPAPKGTFPIAFRSVAVVGHGRWY